MVIVLSTGCPPVGNKSLSTGCPPVGNGQCTDGIRNSARTSGPVI